jgi:cell division protein FtsW
VLALFALLAYSGLRVARRNADPFARLLCGGATVWLCGQAVINIGYVTTLLPVTGIPLPLISAGGTSLLVTLFVLGLMVSCARHEAPAVSAARRAERLGRRSRLERWARIPVPRTYVPPKRRPATPPPARRTPPRPRTQPRRDERSREEPAARYAGRAKRGVA